MKRVYKRQIFKSLDLIIVQFKEEITYNDLKSFIEKVRQNERRAISHKILVDLRYSLIKVTIQEIEMFGNLIHKNKLFSERLSMSFLTKTPEQVAKAMIYSSINCSNPLAIIK